MTFQYFKNREIERLKEEEKKEEFEEAIVMRITKAGIYVIIQKYGIEGYILESNNCSVTIHSDKEEALINGQIRVRTFDHLEVRVIA